MGENFEVIISEKMKILSEFDVEYDEEDLLTESMPEKSAAGYVKTDDQWIVIAVGGKNDLTEAIGNVAFETSSLAGVTEKLKEVLAGKLREEQLDFLEFKNGDDEITVNATSVFPHNRTRPRETVSIINLRPIELDGLEYSALDMTPQTAKTLLENFEKILYRAGE